ncbi:MAG: hypothetical protein AAF481_00630 [Acidobacteriota bacterium]
MNPKLRRISLPVVTLLVAVTAPACFVDRSGLAGWTAEVEPNTICPGDPVTVTWNAGPEGGCERNADGVLMGSGCSDPTRVTITSTPDLFASDPIASEETAGTRTINPTVDTTVDFAASDRDDTLPSYSRAIDVITEDLVQETLFDGSCCGSRICWTALTPGDGDGLPATIRLAELCNPNTFAVRLGIRLGDGSVSTVDLAPAGGDPDCTGELRNVTQVTASTADPTIVGGAVCSPANQNPPRGFSLTATFRCPAT